MALSEEDKKRIEEEEAYRSKVRKVREDLNQPKKKKKGIGCLGIFLIIFVIGLVFSIPSWTGSNTSKPKRDTFKASVNFTGTQFVISNLDDLDCENAKLEVNSGITSGGYKLEGYGLKAGQTYTVGALQFTKDDGTRLNPFQVKPKTFSIYCSSIGSTNALGGAGWYGEFK